MSITLFKAILVNKLSTSRLDMKWSRQKLETSSSRNENESCTKNSLTVRSDKIGTKNLGNLQEGVPMADKMGRSFGQLLINGL